MVVRRACGFYRSMWIRLPWDSFLNHHFTLSIVLFSLYKTLYTANARPKDNTRRSETLALTNLINTRKYKALLQWDILAEMLDKEVVLCFIIRPQNVIYNLQSCQQSQVRDTMITAGLHQCIFPNVNPFMILKSLTWCSYTWGRRRHMPQSNDREKRGEKEIILSFYRYASLPIAPAPLNGCTLAKSLIRNNQIMDTYIIQEALLKLNQ